MYTKEINVSKKLIEGYQYFCDRSHPLANNSGWVYLHRHILSIHIGRWVHSDEVAHHDDDNKTNNDVENLILMSRSEHAKLHSALSRPKKTLINCVVCGKESRTKKYCSRTCMAIAYRRVERPIKSRLSEMIDTMSWCAIGRKFGVSDNAVRKWAKSYELL